LSPGGTATVAVVDKLPDAVGDNWQTAVNVTVPCGRRVTLVDILPLPDALATYDPAVADAVQEADEITVGQFTVTCWSTVVDGPALDATIV